MDFKKLRNKYWSQVVKDYLSCFGTVISTNKVNKIVERLLDDDCMWSSIEESISFHLKEVVKGESDK